MPILIACCLILLPVQALAATLAPWAIAESISGPSPVLNIFGSLIQAWSKSYRHVAGGETVSYVVAGVTLSGFVVVSLVTAAALPRSHRVRRARPYVALAARAMSWIRWIMARNPLDRCADRLSFNPRRANSAIGSTSSTFDTDKPS